MANHQLVDFHPPALARAIITHCAQERYRSDILGDLHEEFFDRSRSSELRARQWYWGQVVRSSPRLLMRRIQCLNYRFAGFMLVSTAITIAMLYIWDLWIARSVAYLIYNRLDSVPIVIARVTYFLTFMIGGALAGVFAGALTFKPEKNFWQNFWHSLLPNYIFLSCFLVVNVLVTAQQVSIIYLFLKPLVLAPMTLIGALLSDKIRAKVHTILKD